MMDLTQIRVGTFLLVLVTNKQQQQEHQCSTHLKVVAVHDTRPARPRKYSRRFHASSVLGVTLARNPKTFAKCPRPKKLHYIRFTATIHVIAVEVKSSIKC